MPRNIDVLETAEAWLMRSSASHDPYETRILVQNLFAEVTSLRTGLNDANEVYDKLLTSD